MAADNWKVRLERFFYDRGTTIEGVPTLIDHCIVSAKDPRISAQPALHADVIKSIVSALRISKQSKVLEVGCASGYIACGLAGYVDQYKGVDLAVAPLDVARKMNLPNAEFLKADGMSLPFTSETFDAAFMYDVFTNFPCFEDGEPIIREMLRVVRPGGKVMVGSVTDRNKSTEFAARVHEVANQLELTYGPPVTPKVNHPSVIERIRRVLAGTGPPKAAPEILVYYFDPDDFIRLGKTEGLSVIITDVHTMNPYFGFRFNVIYTKPNP